MPPEPEPEGKSPCVLDLYKLSDDGRFYNIEVPKGTDIFPFKDPKSILFGVAPLLNWQQYFSTTFLSSHMGRRQHYYDLDMVQLAAATQANPKWGVVLGYPAGDTRKAFMPVSVDLPGLFVRTDDIRSYNKSHPNEKLVIMAFNGDATVPLDFAEWNNTSFHIQWIGSVPTI